MDEDTLKQQLAQAQRQVTLGDRNIGRQRQIIADLEAGGHTTAGAQRLLTSMEDVQRLHVASRDQLQQESAGSD